MKVLHIIWTAGIGGIERLVLDLAVSQQRAEKDVEIFFGYEDGSGGLYNQYINTGIPCHQAGLATGYDCSPSKLWRVLRIFRKFDILHIHSFNPFLMLCARLSGRRIVYTEHGNFGFGRTHTLSDALNDILKKLFLNRWPAYVTFNSYFTQGVALKRYGLEDITKSVVYNGTAFPADKTIDINEMDRDVASQIRGRFVVGTVSRLEGFKRIDRLFRAFALFYAKAEDALLLVVGDGSLRDELESLAKRLDILNKVIFAGYRDNPRVYMGGMNLCVFPSENEPFGLVAIEAMSAGRPVLVFSDSGGMKEIIQGIAPEDIVETESEMARRIEWYFEEKEERPTRQQQRSEYIRQFDIAVMEKRFSDIYDKVLVCAA